MYLDYFDLNERPFSITPDPRFLYMSARHREALAHLLYGLSDNGGFVQLTGEVGTGKTTMCQCLLEQVPENVNIALVLNPKVTASELLATVLDELGVEYPANVTSNKVLIDLLNKHLLEAYANGRHTVLIIDEAQNLSTEVLEQIRLLTNLETPSHKLLKIILIGQPELRDLLAREDMRQLAQRVTARYHLQPLSAAETGAYIRHRLRVTGISKPLFSKGAVRRIQHSSKGVPRLINVLCDRALLGAYVEGKSRVDGRLLGRAAREVLAEQGKRKSPGISYLIWLLIGVATMSLVVLAYLQQPWVTRPAPGPEVADNKPAAVQPEALPALDEAELPPVAADLSGAAGGDTQADTGGEQEPGLDVTELELLLGRADTSWTQQAWRGLFQRWAVQLPEQMNTDYCGYALQYGLLCTPGQGDWLTLRKFNRPAIISLATPEGGQVWGLLQQLSGSQARLVLGGESILASVDQVGAFWYGEYVLLFQATPAGRLQLQLGDRNADVRWLREQLEQIQGVKLLAPDPLLFDNALQQQVMDFQQSRGLLVDGIVGKNTLIQLNTSAGREGVPLLYPGRRG